MIENLILQSFCANPYRAFHPLFLEQQDSPSRTVQYILFAAVWFVAKWHLHHTTFSHHRDRKEMQETSQELERPFWQKEANSWQREEADRAAVFIKRTVSAAKQHLNSVDFCIIIIILFGSIHQRERNKPLIERAEILNVKFGFDCDVWALFIVLLWALQRHRAGITELYTSVLNKKIEAQKVPDVFIVFLTYQRCKRRRISTQKNHS